MLVTMEKAFWPHLRKIHYCLLLEKILPTPMYSRQLTERAKYFRKTWRTNADRNQNSTNVNNNFSSEHICLHPYHSADRCSRVIAMVMHHKPTYSTFVRYRSSHKKYIGRWDRISKAYSARSLWTSSCKVIV